MELNYDPNDKDKMKLPVGKTCGDCVHILRCKAMFGHTETDTSCDWSPSRFHPMLKTPSSMAPSIVDMNCSTLQAIVDELREITGLKPGESLSAEVRRLVGVDSHREFLASQADEIDVECLVRALTIYGIATPEGGLEGAAAHIGLLVNSLTAEVVRNF